MKKFFSFALVVLSILMISCADSQIDARLGEVDLLLDSSSAVAGDSLIDRASRILEEIDTASMTSEHDRRLYDLLTVERRYKSFVPLTATDGVKARQAAVFFHDNGDTSREVRAVTMQGAVAEDCGRLVEALERYKKAAELSKDEIPKLNAMAHFRIATLYDVNQMSERKKVIAHYKEAERQFASLRDSVKMVRCYFNLAHVYGHADNDSTLYYLEKSLSVASQMRDTVMIAESLCGLSSWYLNKRRADLAFSYARQASALSGFLPDGVVTMSLVNACSAMGDGIEARRLFESIDSTKVDIDMYLLSRQLLSAATGDYRTAYESLGRRYEISDSLLTSDIQMALIRADVTESLIRAKMEQGKLVAQRRLMLSALIILVLIIAALVLYARYRKREKAALTAVVEQLRHDKQVLIGEKSALVGENERLMTDVDRHLSSFMALAENVSYVKDIDKMTARLKETMRNVIDTDFWTSVCELAQHRQPGIIEKARRTGGLSDRETYVVALSVCGCSALIISVLLDFKNYRYVYAVKSNIAAKLGRNTLEDYITEYSFSAK